MMWDGFYFYELEEPHQPQVAENFHGWIMEVSLVEWKLKGYFVPTFASDGEWIHALRMSTGQFNYNTKLWLHLQLLM